MVLLFLGAGRAQKVNNVFMAAPLSHTEWCPPLPFLRRIIKYLSRPVFLYLYCATKGSHYFPLFIYELKRLGNPDSGIDVGAAGDKQFNNLQVSLSARPNQSVLIERADLVDVCATVQQQRDNLRVSFLRGIDQRGRVAHQVWISAPVQ